MTTRALPVCAFLSVPAHSDAGNSGHILVGSESSKTAVSQTAVLAVLAVLTILNKLVGSGFLAVYSRI